MKKANLKRANELNEIIDEATDYLQEKAELSIGMRKGKGYSLRDVSIMVPEHNFSDIEGVTKTLIRERLKSIIAKAEKELEELE